MVLGSKNAPTLNIIFSTRWDVPQAHKDMLAQLKPAWRKEFARLLENNPHCCELTNLNFCKLLAQVAREHGFNIVRWPVSGKSDWMRIARAARNGSMVPGAAAVMMHSWYGGYDKECVPAWDFYPVLEAIAARQELLYPSAALDQLHSEKMYTSKLMPPTQIIRLVRNPSSNVGWTALRRGKNDIACALDDALQILSKESKRVGLSFKDVMVKQGLSWGGRDVARVAPNAAAIRKHVQKTMLPKVPTQVRELTVLLQTKVDLVAELRWVILDGQLRGRGWRTFLEARRGHPVQDAGMHGEVETREALKDAGLVQDEEGFKRLEESMRGKVEQVLKEATVDAGGEIPQFLRVDLLVDKQGRVWLGERESWGADLVKSTLNPRTGKYSRQDPSKREVASAMVSRALRCLRKQAVFSQKRPFGKKVLQKQHPKCRGTGGTGLKIVASRKTLNASSRASRGKAITRPKTRKRQATSMRSSVKKTRLT